MKRSHNIPIAERVNRVLLDISKKMGGYKVKIGWLADSPLSTYSDGTPVASAMYWFEFGHEGRFPSPPRPVFRTMVSKESPSWPGKVAALAKATNYNGARVMAIMGDDIAGALRDSLINITEPALSPTTLILRAKFWGADARDKITITDVLQAQIAAASGVEGATGTQAKPGVWTGQALRAISFEVSK